VLPEQRDRTPTAQATGQLVEHDARNQTYYGRTSPAAGSTGN